MLGIDEEIYNGNKYIRINGWNKWTIYSLIKEIESITFSSVTIICDEWNFIDIFENNSCFGLHKVQVSDKFIDDCYEKFGLSRNYKILVVIHPDNDEHLTHGIIVD